MLRLRLIKVQLYFRAFYGDTRLRVTEKVIRFNWKQKVVTSVLRRWVDEKSLK